MRNTILRRDLKRRLLFRKNEHIHHLRKIVQQNFKVKKIIRMHYTEKLTGEILKDFSLSRVRNRCILTGRGRSIYRDFRLSRMQLRHLASFGYIVGIKKSSW